MGGSDVYRLVREDPVGDFKALGHGDLPERRSVVPWATVWSRFAQEICYLGKHALEIIWIRNRFLFGTSGHICQYSSEYTMVVHISWCGFITWFAVSYMIFSADIKCKVGLHNIDCGISTLIFALCLWIALLSNSQWFFSSKKSPISDPYYWRVLTLLVISEVFCCCCGNGSFKIVSASLKGSFITLASCLCVSPNK